MCFLSTPHLICMIASLLLRAVTINQALPHYFLQQTFLQQHRGLGRLYPPPSLPAAEFGGDSLCTGWLEVLAAQFLKELLHNRRTCKTQMMPNSVYKFSLEQLNQASEKSRSSKSLRDY